MTTNAVVERRFEHLRIVGESARWRDVLRKAMLVAATDATIPVSGESGTGKEVVRGSSIARLFEAPNRLWQ